MPDCAPVSNRPGRRTGSSASTLPVTLIAQPHLLGLSPCGTTAGGAGWRRPTTTAHGRQGHGPRAQRVRRSHARRPHRRSGRRAHPLQHLGLRPAGATPAGVPRAARHEFAARPRRQPDRHRRSRWLGTLPGIMSRRQRVLAELLARHVVDFRARTSPRVRRRPPRPRDALAGLLDSGHLYRVRDPTASVHSASPASTAGGCWPRDPVARHRGARYRPRLEPGEVVVMTPTAHARSAPSRPSAVTSGSACSSSSTSPGPTRSSTAATSTRPGASASGSRRRHPSARRSGGPARAALVVPVPESGVPAAQGFARASGSRTATGW